MSQEQGLKFKGMLAAVDPFVAQSFRSVFFPELLDKIYPGFQSPQGGLEILGRQREELLQRRMAGAQKKDQFRSRILRDTVVRRSIATPAALQVNMGGYQGLHPAPGRLHGRFVLQDPVQQGRKLLRIARVTLAGQKTAANGAAGKFLLEPLEGFPESIPFQEKIFIQDVKKFLQSFPEKKLLEFSHVGGLDIQPRIFPV
jgi:hypothetical protein